MLFTLSAAVAVGATGSATAASAEGGPLSHAAPASRVECRASDDGAHAQGATTHGTGTLEGNVAEGPVGANLTQCGGTNSLVVPPASGVLFLQPALQNMAQKLRGA